ncbi:nucleotide-binding universal stress UspA family protein [Granulicella aggregans]|uniref:Nucleotide-binding universal stress UspA family protein n=1 Tax=Granulicella aggregans TaxID=474949 RepID=A0A7W7ZHB7_9BACT|nr:universal stress protein [Granulicella aggregans]MBB5059925.1 nucleotide-binding universal stress UspA family protein [Granulicella aggregans]
MPIAGARFNPTKILVPTDFSISSLAALAAATDLALLFHAEVLLLHVMPVLPIVSGDDLPTPFPERQEFLRVAEEEAQETLTQWVSDLSGRGIEASLKVTVSNDVVDKVISTIEQQGINMLVLSTHGMSGWRPMVFGSIAEKLIKLAGCPVLLLRSAATPA